MKIAPSIFQQRRLEEEERIMLRKALDGIPGASELLGDGQNKPIEPPVAFLVPDARRDRDAQTLLESNRVSAPAVQQTGMLLTCWSSNSVDTRGAPVAYTIWLGYDSSASCTCADFQRHGGACKHMRAALLRVRTCRDWALHHRLNEPIVYTPNIELPADKASATRLHAHANRYVVVGRQGASGATTNAQSARTAVSRAAYYVDEALRGGFLDDLDDGRIADLEADEEWGAGGEGIEPSEGGDEDCESSSGYEIDEVSEILPHLRWRLHFLSFCL